MTQDTPSESSETQDTPKTTTQAEPPRSKPRAKKKSPGGRGGMWLWLLLLLMAAIAAGGWYLWQEMEEGQHQQLNELETAVEELREQLRAERQTRERESEQRQQEFQTLETQLETQMARQLEQQAQQRDQALSALDERLENTQRRLRAMSTTNREDWKLAEAQYLLRLANQRLLMERDATNALAMAEQVEQIFQTLNDGRLHGVRRALARDVRALRMADQVDREGIYLQMLSLTEQLQELPLADPLERLEGEDVQGLDAEPPGPDATRWQRIRYNVTQSFRNLRAALSDHLRIRRHDEPIAAQITTTEHFYLRQNLQLMMEQAQLALLREQPDIYRANLERAADWLEQYYGLNSQTGDVQDELRELAALSIRPELPDLSDTLSRLQSHMENLQRPEQEPDEDDQEREENEL
ncbi:uroporphyrinogen-III C-methyltransferase [Marinimicrobium sp. ABcell2]|uniref:uroporphyrinogen-III C-methyltransferase n=1 Tax=Marinimicrobium sp. ABcell2 TaxID=3069751 RepID=UPI0027B3BC25|nr:uroporphyrinogen-III C-methyltransferase [Marinimicrobium sp. ABcell2]MDQ2076938.1 uroporphyrinogen-III C-methyltransferase [Marinimicrobium sp. ABcell2]